MSFAGHVLDMIQRMRQNREMTNKRESLKDIQSHSKGHYKHRPTPQPNFPRYRSGRRIEFKQPWFSFYFKQPDLDQLIAMFLHPLMHWGDLHLLKRFDETFTSDVRVKILSCVLENALKMHEDEIFYKAEAEHSHEVEEPKKQSEMQEEEQRADEATSVVCLM